MNFRRLSSATVIASALLTLSACGGGDDAPVASPQNLPSLATSFATRVSASLSALGTSSGLTSAAVADLFDAQYLDMGFTKANLVSALAANATALGTNPELSLFPLAAVTNPTLSNCDANNICTLNATLVNSDADTTSVDFTTKVKVVSGVVYFYGDQSSTASI